jgi:hypothetical protein
MPTYIALTYTPEVDWYHQPEYAEGLAEYTAFEEAHAAVLRGGHALYPTATARTVQVSEGEGDEPVVSDGPYAETKEALTGFYLLECADLDEAVAVAAKIPAARYGTIEVRQIHPTLDT